MTRLENWKRISVALVGLVAVAGLSLAGAALTGLASEKNVEPLAATAGEGKREVIGTFTGEIDAETTTGTIDFRTSYGRIQLVGWDEDAYEITVYGPKYEGEDFGDVTVEPKFDAAEEGDAVHLSLVIEPEGTWRARLDPQSSDGGIRLGGSYDTFDVVAYVPARIAWESVYACSGTSHGWTVDLGGILGDDDERDVSCVKDETLLTTSVSFNPDFLDDGSDDEDEEEEETIPFRIENLHGTKLAAHAYYQNLEVENVRFDEAFLASYYGNLAGSVDAKEVAASTYYGNAVLAGTGDEFGLASYYGSIALTVLDSASGAIKAASYYGDVLVQVPHGDDRGYSAAASTYYGKAVIALSDAETQSTRDAGENEEDAEEDEEDDDDPFVLGLPGKALSDPPKPPEPPKGHGRGDSAKAKSHGFENKPIQVEIVTTSYYGDILVTDGAAPDFEPGSDGTTAGLN